MMMRDSENRKVEKKNWRTEEPKKTDHLKFHIENRFIKKHSSCGVFITSTHTVSLSVSLSLSVCLCI